MNNFGEHNEAINILQKAIALQEELVHTKNQGTTHGTFEDDTDEMKKQLFLIELKLNLANAYRLANQLDQSRKNITDAKAQLESMDPTFALGTNCLANIAEAELEFTVKKYPQALDANDRALKLLQTAPAKKNELMIKTLFQRRDILESMGRKNEAISIDTLLRNRVPPAVYEQFNSANKSPRPKNNDVRPVR